VYVGIDLHRRTSHVAAFDEEGLELLSRRVPNDPEALRAIFAELGGDARVPLEAFGWEWLADLLEAEAHAPQGRNRGFRTRCNDHVTPRARVTSDGEGDARHRAPPAPRPRNAAPERSGPGRHARRDRRTRAHARGRRATHADVPPPTAANCGCCARSAAACCKRTPTGSTRSSASRAAQSGPERNRAAQSGPERLIRRFSRPSCRWPRIRPDAAHSSSSRIVSSVPATRCDTTQAGAVRCARAHEPHVQVPTSSAW
jgi:hypothetical protein